MEKVSVIIPVYNDEKYLKQCVESVRNQSYSNLEIILVNDGSTDNSLAICEELRQNDDRVRVLNRVNSGVGSSRNAGLAMATGDYVLFVDNDDWLLPDHIKNLYQLLKKNNADIAVGNFLFFNEKDAKFGIVVTDDMYFEKNYTPQEWFKVQYMSAYNMSMIFTVPWCKLYRRSLFKNIAYPIDALVEDDLTTWKVYLLADKISFMNKTIYTHRRFSHSVSASVSRTSLFPIEAVEDRLSFLALLGFDTSGEEEAYRYRLQICIDDALKTGDYVKYKNAMQKMAILKKYHKA